MTDEKNKILDLTMDFAFKSVFSNENYKWYLSFIISYCTKLDIDYIYNNLKYKSNFIGNKNLDKKLGDGDILVEVENNIINLEMNTNISKYLIKKNKKYVTMLDSINTEKSKEGKIKDKYIVQINISKGPRIKGTNELLYEIVQMDRNLKKEDMYNNYIIYDINLEYLKKEIYNKNKLTRSEKRLLVFIERDKSKLEEIFEGDKEMKKTVEDLDSLRYFEAFEEYTKQFNTEKFRKLVEEDVRQEAIKTAKKEGKEEGLREGKEEGLKEGKEEVLKEVVKSMLEENIPMEQISKITGLSKEEIKSIK